MVCAWVLVPLGRVYLIDPGAVPQTAHLKLETQSMFWLLHPGGVISTEANVLVPMNSEDWREKKGQFDELTGRTWPNPESSNRAKFTQQSTQEYWRRKLLSNMESVNWVCDVAMEGHEWVSEATVSMEEYGMLVALNYEIDVPCAVQWGLLWFSSPSRRNQRFADHDANVRAETGSCSSDQTKIGMWAGRCLVGDRGSGLCFFR